MDTIAITSNTNLDPQTVNYILLEVQRRYKKIDKFGEKYNEDIKDGMKMENQHIKAWLMMLRSGKHVRSL